MATSARPQRRRGVGRKGSLMWALCVVVSVGCTVGQTAPSSDPDNNNGTRISSAANGTPFVWCDYGVDNLSFDQGTSTVSITMPDTTTGARIHTDKRYAYGNFSAMIKCPAGDITGLVPNFYTSSAETAGVNPVQDEIDFEFLGKNKSQVQVNYYVAGNSTGNEKLVDLGFDCSDAFHEYRIDWTPIRIKWFIDGALVHTVYHLSGQPYPTLPGFLYSSIWDASKILNGTWAGSPSSNAAAPFRFQLAHISAVELADLSFNDNATAAAPAPVATLPPAPPSSTQLPIPVGTRAPGLGPAPLSPNPWGYPAAPRMSRTTFVVAVSAVAGALALLLGAFVFAVIQRKRAFAAPSEEAAAWNTDSEAARGAGLAEPEGPPAEVGQATWLHRLSMRREMTAFSRIPPSKG